MKIKYQIEYKKFSFYNPNLEYTNDKVLTAKCLQDLNPRNQKSNNKSKFTKSLREIKNSFNPFHKNDDYKNKGQPFIVHIVDEESKLFKSIEYCKKMFKFWVKIGREVRIKNFRFIKYKEGEDLHFKKEDSNTEYIYYQISVPVFIARINPVHLELVAEGVISNPKINETSSIVKSFFTTPDFIIHSNFHFLRSIRFFRLQNHILESKIKLFFSNEKFQDLIKVKSSFRFKMPTLPFNNQKTSLDGCTDNDYIIFLSFVKVFDDGKLGEPKVFNNVTNKDLVCEGELIKFSTKLLEIGTYLIGLNFCRKCDAKDPNYKFDYQHKIAFGDFNQQTSNKKEYLVEPTMENLKLTLDFPPIDKELNTSSHEGNTKTTKTKTTTTTTTTTNITNDTNTNHAKTKNNNKKQLSKQITKKLELLSERNNTTTTTTTNSTKITNDKKKNSQIEKNCNKKSVTKQISEELKTLEPSIFSFTASHPNIDMDFQSGNKKRRLEIGSKNDSCTLFGDVSNISALSNSEQIANNNQSFVFPEETIQPQQAATLQSQPPLYTQPNQNPSPTLSSQSQQQQQQQQYQQLLCDPLSFNQQLLPSYEQFQNPSSSSQPSQYPSPTYDHQLEQSTFQFFP